MYTVAPSRSLSRPAARSAPSMASAAAIMGGGTRCMVVKSARSAGSAKSISRREALRRRSAIFW